MCSCCFEILEPQPADKDMDVMCAECSSDYRKWLDENSDDEDIAEVIQ